jgi:ferredoxin-NADP reductase
MTLVVQDKRPVADGIVELVLNGVAGASELDPWTPGAHIGLVLAPGLVRQYSLCGDPADRQAYRVAVLREPNGRGGSAYVHDQLQVGDTLTVHRPRNNFELKDAPRYLFVAGGIGITPILAMLAEADRQQSDWQLVYGGKSESSMAYLAELIERWGPRIRALPQDRFGLLPVDDLVSGLAGQDRLYCCGPTALLEAVEDSCRRRSFSRLHSERFSAIVDEVPLRPLEVVLAGSGVTLKVAADQSILEAVEDAGVPVDSSCREGTCGTCETRVLAGRPDHRDALLSEDEREAGDTMFICVSRTLSERLVLDL